MHTPQKKRRQVLYRCKERGRALNTARGRERGVKSGRSQCMRWTPWNLGHCSDAQQCARQSFVLFLAGAAEPDGRTSARESRHF
mmetsp:Transcript_39486/g.113947  ORF Transcript_39486/g.113947 Transcript_39486/m.113947 type:complete len:84 (-) Transcript_39486:1245-1496(-)